MTQPLSDLLEPGRKPSRIVVGLMSGTSADSIDVAVCRMKGRGADVGVELLHYREHPHDPEVRRRVLASDGMAPLDRRRGTGVRGHLGSRLSTKRIGREGRPHIELWDLIRFSRIFDEVGLSPDQNDRDSPG